MAERLRIYVGANELNYVSAYIEKTPDQVINNGKMETEANANLTDSSMVDFKKADGSTTIFTATVSEIVESMMHEVKLLSNGEDLQNIWVEQVYLNKSPEYIVQDLVDNWTTTLTYASTGSSGVTIERYIAKGYLIDIIKDMMDLLQWILRIDESDNVYFEQEGTLDNGVIFNNGVNINITSWKRDKQELINHVKVKGQKITSHLTETVTDTNTVFDLSNKPVGSFRVIISGSEVPLTAPNDPYTVDAENKTVTFTSSRTNPTFDYDYEKPVVVDYQDDDSISTYKEKFRELEAPWLNGFSDARKYAKEYVDVHKDVFYKPQGYIPGMVFDYEVGERIYINDSIRNKSGYYIIRKIKWVAEKNQTEMEFGRRDFILMDWQRGVQERIKKLERRVQDDTEPAFSRLMKHDMLVTLTLTETWEYNSPEDNKIVGHLTLGRMRSGLDAEPDCSDNNHGGTWTGTGVSTGAQYTTSGWRLSGAEFNGSDRKCTVSDHVDLDLSSNFTIVGAVKVASLPGAETYLFGKYDGTDGWAVRINSSDKVELVYSNSGSDSIIDTDTVLSIGAWNHYAFKKSSTSLTAFASGLSSNTGTGGASAGTNSEDFIVGEYSGDYFTGFQDEIRLYDAAITDVKVLNISNGLQELDDLVCYLSFDNPKLGDRSTSRTSV